MPIMEPHSKFQRAIPCLKCAGDTTKVKYDYRQRVAFLSCGRVKQGAHCGSDAGYKPRIFQELFAVLRTNRWMPVLRLASTQEAVVEGNAMESQEKAADDYLIRSG